MVRDDGGPGRADARRRWQSSSPTDRKNGTVVGNACQVTDGRWRPIGDQATAERGRCRRSAASAVTSPGSLRAAWDWGRCSRPRRVLQAPSLELADCELFGSTGVRRRCSVHGGGQVGDVGARRAGRTPLGEFPLERLNVNGGAIARPSGRSERRQAAAHAADGDAPLPDAPRAACLRGRRAGRRLRAGARLMPVFRIEIPTAGIAHLVMDHPAQGERARRQASPTSTRPHR